MAKHTLTETNGPILVTKIIRALGTNPKVTLKEYNSNTGGYTITHDKIKGIIKQGNEIIITLEKAGRRYISVGDVFRLYHDKKMGRRFSTEYSTTIIQA